MWHGNPCSVDCRVKTPLKSKLVCLAMLIQNQDKFVCWLSLKKKGKKVSHVQISESGIFKKNTAINI